MRTPTDVPAPGTTPPPRTAAGSGTPAGTAHASTTTVTHPPAGRATGLLRTLRERHAPTGRPVSYSSRTS
ncbi:MULTISPECIES: hypothetical protein [unclassified Streptomyces]|uniref:hypothetical protein n=1 Tax=unclassified Streptomyces TaxID=2593676 RepID=UPI002E7FFA5C|nr:hypothetical protein [Streptomyces sp. NBC_00589]WTI33661.1 hypothetical protein OIC96_00855 [Streptomyces sp. NBC_00775]WUB32667.1 hypothetical protein OHA51_48880 [Streptomyces sp. NBC_00589]